MRGTGKPTYQETITIEMIVYFSEFLRERGMHETGVNTGKHWLSREAEGEIVGKSLYCGFLGKE